MLNTLPVKSEGRIPRGLLFINGQQIVFTKIEVSTTTFYQADTIDIDIPVNGQPQGFGLEYFSNMPAMLVEVYVGFPSNPANFSKEDLYKLITAQVDDVEVQMDETSINLIGRDLTAKFIDNQTYEKFQNLTPSQIATLLAKRRGLTPVVTPVSIKAGQIYDSDHAAMTQQSEWDLLTYLAQSVGFVVYVQDQSLYFKPEPEPSDNPYVLQWSNLTNVAGTYSFNGSKLKLGRNLTLARDVIVKVRSWNGQYPRGFTKTAKAVPNKRTLIPSKAQPIGDAQTYVRDYPGLTPQQALQKAQQLLKEISQHERRIRATLPGDNLINKDSIIKLTGTNSDWDQVYYPSEIVRRFSLDEGYTMEIAAKNHSPNSEVLG